MGWGNLGEVEMEVKGLMVGGAVRLRRAHVGAPLRWIMSRIARFGENGGNLTGRSRV